MAGVTSIAVAVCIVSVGCGLCRMCSDRKSKRASLVHLESREIGRKAISCLGNCLRRPSGGGARAPLWPPNVVGHLCCRRERSAIVMSAKAIAAARPAPGRRSAKSCARCGLPFGPGEKYTIVAEQHFIKCYAPSAAPRSPAAAAWRRPASASATAARNATSSATPALHRLQQAASTRVARRGTRAAGCTRRASRAPCAPNRLTENSTSTTTPTCERCHAQFCAALRRVPNSLQAGGGVRQGEGQGAPPVCFGCAVCATPLNIEASTRRMAAYRTALRRQIWLEVRAVRDADAELDAELPRRQVLQQPRRRDAKVLRLRPPRARRAGGRTTAPPPAACRHRALAAPSVVSPTAVERCRLLRGRSVCNCACPPRCTTSRRRRRSSPPSAPSSPASARRCRRWSACRSRCSTATRSPGWRRRRSTRPGGTSARWD